MKALEPPPQWDGATATGACDPGQWRGVTGVYRTACAHGGLAEIGRSAVRPRPWPPPRPASAQGHGTSPPIPRSAAVARDGPLAATIGRSLSHVDRTRRSSEQCELQPHQPGREDGRGQAHRQRLYRPSAMRRVSCLNTVKTARVCGGYAARPLPVHLLIRSTESSPISFAGAIRAAPRPPLPHPPSSGASLLRHASVRLV
jgi:hypothetical protein